MAPRANWKGFLKVAELTCPVALYTAASTSERISFHTLNRETGHRVRRRYVDEESGKRVETEDQVKGYEVGQGDYVVLEPEELAAAVPESDKTLAVSAFVPREAVDEVYFDKPYYLAPSGAIAEESFAVIREGLRKKGVAALATAVLFRRMRTLLVEAHGTGLVATTLHFDYEVRAASEVFSEIPKTKVEGEMLELARHIIETKKGEFDPRVFDDRYEEALAELIKAKIEGRPIERKKAPEPAKVVDLMEALRQSAGVPAPQKTKRAAAKASSPTKRSKPAEEKRERAPRRKAS